MEPRTFHPICQTKKIGFPIPALTVSNVMLEQWDVEKGDIALFDHEHADALLSNEVVQ